MGSNHIRRFLCGTIVLFCLSLFSFHYFFFSFFLFCTYFSSFIIVTKFISNFQFKQYNMNFKLRLRKRCLSSNILHHYLLSLRWLFLSQNHLRQIWQMVEVRRLLRCPGCQLTRLFRTFAKCMIKRQKVVLGLPAITHHHFPTIVSTVPLYLGCRLSMSKSSHCHLLQLNLSR